MSIDSNESTKKADDPLGCLPKDLADQLGRSGKTESALAATPCDLDAGGMFTEGYLLLTDSQLGHYCRRNGDWEGRWINTASLTEANLIEAVGMNILRLVSDGQLVDEYRFTLRHKKLVGQFQRQLERVIDGDGDGHAQDAPHGPHERETRKTRCEKCDRFIPAWTDICQACMSRRKILFRLLDFVRPYKARAVTAFALALILTAMGLAQPPLSAWLIDEGLGTGEGKTANFAIILIAVGTMTGLLLVRTVGTWGRLRLSLEIARRVARAIRHDVYEHMHRLSLDFFSKRQTGALVTRVTTDTERLWSFIATVAIEMVLSILLILGVGICLFVWNWKLAFFALLPLPLMGFLTIFFHKRLHQSFRRQWHRWSQMTAVVADALPGVRVIKAFSQEKREVDRFEEKSTALFNEEQTYIRGARSLFEPAMMFSAGLGSLIIWVVGGWWYCRGNAGLTPGTLVGFQLFLGMFLRPIHQLAHMDDALNRAATSAQRIFEILDTQPKIYSKAQATLPDELAGQIELRNVSFSYDGVHKVLKNIDITIEAGHMVGLAGPSGGGKTTMVNLISRFYDVLEGQILIDGVDVRDYDITQLRQKIGVVLQEPFLFHGTISENIAYGKPHATLDEIIGAARAANANDFIVGFADGYDTMVGERGQTLSGGERQRISIARAILNNPAVLILDEATSSVDTETEELIQAALDTLTANRTTIAIAHRLSTLRKADRLIILDKGDLIEEGPHEELAEKEDGLYARLLQMQRKSQSYIALTGA
ncbi:MAG: ABC transporter ATP-binding protein [Planctomycetota bacterium]